MKKFSKKLTALVMAVVMMMAMGVTAFAAAPSGSYQVKLYGSSGSEAPHNPIEGVTFDDDAETFTVYLKPLKVLGIYGYVKTLTIEDATFVSSKETTTTLNGHTVTYPSEMTYSSEKITSAIAGTGEKKKITYELAFVGTSIEHQNNGSMEILSSKN